jgi:hypothetical protein
MYQKQKGLAMNYTNLEKIYAIENKIVSIFPVAGCLEKKGAKIEGNSR